MQMIRRRTRHSSSWPTFVGRFGLAFMRSIDCSRKPGPTSAGCLVGEHLIVVRTDNAGKQFTASRLENLFQSFRCAFNNYSRGRKVGDMCGLAPATNAARFYPLARPIRQPSVFILAPRRRCSRQINEE